MNKKGFTLIETVIAMVILSAGIILLANTWGGSFMRVRKTQLSTEVASLLQRKIVELQIEYRDKPLESIPEEKQDDFGSDYPQYSWKMTAKKMDLPDLSAALTAKDGGADQMLITLIKQLSEHIGNSVKEVKVSIIYKGAKKPLEFSATTYFVDYEKELPIGGAVGASK